VNHAVVGRNIRLRDVGAVNLQLALVNPYIERPSRSTEV
jgi:hypothetical protein